MRILLIRHGQTDLNMEKKLQGSSEIPLNDRGRQQAIETNKILKEKKLIPTIIFSSPLGRAIETACIVTGIDLTQYSDREITATNKPPMVKIDNNLIEMSFGIYEKKNMSIENPKFLDECFGHPETYKPPEGGESYDEVLLRAGKAIELLRKRIENGEFKENDIIMLVSHGAIGHGILEYIKKTPRAAYWNVEINNCAIIELFLSKDGKNDDYKYISYGLEKNW